MRIALLLSGQPRFIEEGAKYIIPNVCEGNNVDTFCHFWMDDDLVNKPYKYGGDGEWVNQRIDSKAVDKAVEIYKPITYAVDRSKSFVDSAVHFETPKNKYWGGGEPEMVHYSDNMHQPDGMINDWFDFGGSKQMDAFMSVFPVWQLILEKCMRETEGAWCHELMHRKMLDSFGIGVQPCNIHITLPRF